MAALTDETIMAYADGALPPDEARTVEAALAADASLAARVEMFRRSRQRTKAALEPLAAEPVPDALTARVLAAAAAAAPEHARREDGEPAGAAVVPFRARRRAVPGAASRAPWGAALAASLALAVGLGAGYTVGTREPAGALRMAPLDTPAIAAALSSVAAGEEARVGADRFRAIATFRVDGGGLCREFEVDYADRSSVVAVACRADDTWGLTFSVASAATDEGYAPVSSMEALEGYLSAVGAAPPLEPAEEAEALATLR